MTLTAPQQETQEMDLIDQELIAEFVIESQEGLSNVENQMLAIEEAGEEMDSDMVDSVFRTMHSIKGTASFLGLERIETLAHSLEEVLNLLRNREAIPTTELVNTVLRAADYITELIAAVETSNEKDVSQYVAELQKLRPSDETSAPSNSDAAQPNERVVEELEASAIALSETVVDYLVECHDNLQAMEQHIDNLELTTDKDPLIREVFRTVHTIKGGAGFLGFNSIEKLAHLAENLLCQIRDGDREFTPEIGTVLLSTTDRFREGLSLVESSGTDDAFFPQAAIDQLAAIENALSTSESDDDPMRQESAVEINASDIHSVVHSLSAESINDLPLKSTATSAEDRTSQEPNSSAAPEMPTREPVLTRPAAEQPVRPSVEAREEKTVSAPAPRSDNARSENAGSEKPQTTVCESTIRVDVGLLDKLMTRVGELVLARNQVLQYTCNLEDSSFVSTAQRLNLITTELQEDVMKTRMQPIGNVWSKFPRVVRDLSSQLGKEVRIEMEGKETELDKTIIEAIKDPLTHIIRNAVDHGIETPDVRVAANKPAEGHLLLRAYHEGGQVNIEMIDDGAGLNVDRIRQKAIERGLVSSEQASRMTEREAAQLVLLPGFSTAAQVTNVSGRGVGMDVVKTNIERIGGMIDLQSRPGQGTTVKVKIPLTLAIIPALIVTNEGDRYAIPQASLLELVRLEGEQARGGIEFVHGAPVYRLRGKLLPLVSLSESLGMRQGWNPFGDSGVPPHDDLVNIVVLRANEQQFGLVVDKVNDTEEIVVKPLSRQLKSISEYAGATIMGDGAVALILDVMGLATAAGLAGEVHETPLQSTVDDKSDQVNHVRSLLIVDLDDARRFAMPVSMVSRLEKIPRTSIEIADGREVIQYRGSIMPVVRLANVFGAPQGVPADPDHLQIVVYADETESYGLVVNRILDAVETEVDLSYQKEVEDNLLGTAIIQGKVTDVLNLPNLAKQLTSAATTSLKMSTIGATS